MLGDGVVELHNLERGGVDLNLQGVKKPKTNLLEQEPKRDLVPMRICAKPYITSERINRFAKGQTKHKFHHLTFHSEEVVTENLLLRKDLLLKVCELIGKTPSLD